jgi:hypothetical protein
MSNELFIACGAISIIAVVSSLGVGLLSKRSSQLYQRTWALCIGVLFALVAAYTWRAFASYYEGPRRGGALNPGGPSGYIIEDLLVLATSAIAVPASYIGFLLLSLLPPKGIQESTARRVRVYGASVVVIAAAAAMYYRAARADDVRQERDASLERLMRMFNE